MKVLFITPWYPHSQNPSSGIFVKDLAKSVSGYVKPTVVHIHRSKSLEGLISVSKYAEDGLSVYRISVRHLPLKFHVFLFIAVIGHLLKIEKEVQPDIIHANVYHAGIFSIILGRLRGIPVVLTEHMVFRKGSEGSPLDAVRQFFGRFALNRAHLVTSPSVFFKRHLRGAGISSEIKVVPNAVDTSLFRPVPRRGADTDRVKMLYVGWIDSIKGIDRLLVAIEELLKMRNDFSVQIVGEGGLKEPCIEMCRRKGMDGFVVFLGSKSRDEVIRLMQECDFLVLPSSWEVFGVVVIEAMACGKPVVVSDKGQKEIVVTKAGLVVDAANPGLLAEALNFMIENHRKFPSSFIRKYTSSKYSYEVIGEMLVDVYSRVRSQYEQMHSKAC